MTETFSEYKIEKNKNYEIKYRKPDEMKDSGIEWLEEIPKDWEKFKLNRVSKNKKYSFVDGPFGSELKNEEYKQKGIPIIQLNNIRNGKHVLKNLNFIDKKKYSSLIKHSAFPGDIVFAKMAYPVARCCKVSKIYDKYLIVADCIKMSPKDSFDLDFLVYTINDKYVNHQAEIYAKGSTRKRINLVNLKELFVFIPEYKFQLKIANFLDVKTAEFDNIIQKKEELIKKLEEAKKSLISEVVSGKVKIVDGELLPRKPEEMKDSGVEWLGEIPKDWDIKRIKYLFSLRNERNTKKREEVQLLSLYTSFGVRKSDEIENKTGNIVRTVKEYKCVHAKDIIVNIILAWMGSIGVSEYSGVISPAYDIYKPRENTNSNYYSYLFRTPSFSGECFKYGRGIMMMRWRTYSDEFLSIKTCYPSFIQQQKIARFLDKKTKEIDCLIQKNKTYIEKLKEAKQSLISEAVTGKIDLRDWDIIETGEQI